jgi:hypothetical protein
LKLYLSIQNNALAAAAAAANRVTNAKKKKTQHQTRTKWGKFIEMRFDKKD